MLESLRYLRQHRALLRATIFPKSKPPGKDVYRQTITPDLRAFLVELGGPTRAFLEIGCDVGLTLTDLAPRYERLVGIEVNPTKVRIARVRARGLKNVSVVRGTAYDIPLQSYDVVLVDAVHLYTDVLIDVLCVLNRTTGATLDLVFHDYGLIGGEVRDFVDDLFPDAQPAGALADWNLLGQGSDGPEAAWVRVRREDALGAVRAALSREARRVTPV